MNKYVDKYMLYELIDSEDSNNAIVLFCNKFNLPKRCETALFHLSIYRDYYYETEEPLNQSELGKIIGRDRKVIGKELNILKEIFGLDSLKHIKTKINNKNMPVTPLIVRLPFYIKNVYRKNVVCNVKDIAKDLGISEEEVIKDVKELKDIYNIAIRVC